VDNQQNVVRLTAPYSPGAGRVQVNGLAYLATAEVLPNRVTITGKDPLGAHVESLDGTPVLHAKHKRHHSGEITGVYSIGSASGSEIRGMVLVDGTDGPFPIGSVAVLQHS
jgi:hypothetical protein